jgi:hypothetical protein
VDGPGVVGDRAETKGPESLRVSRSSQARTFFPMFFLRQVMVALVKNLSMCAQSVVAIKPLHVAEFRMISIAIWQSSS